VLPFSALKKNLKKDFGGLKPVKVAVLADSASQLLVQAIRGHGYEQGFDFELFEADYNQVNIQIFDTSSEYYAFRPEYTLLFESTQKLVKKFCSLGQQEKRSFAQDHIRHVQQLIDSISGQTDSKIIYFNFSEISDNVYGNYANKTDSSFIYQLRKINYELMHLAQTNKVFFINDLSALQNQYGFSFVTDEKVYITTDLLFSIDFLPVIAKNTVDIIQSIAGKIIKCVILDLDNTLWGGIIGDDGIESIQIGDLGIGKAFTELQRWLKELKERGIILAVCSKNTEHIAKEPFERHPDMILRLSDIAVFVANWETKVDNIRHIRSILNIGFDSIVFLDDNPFERDIVRTHIPELTVPELPEDPAEYLNFLKLRNLFETASFTEEDSNRTRQYQEEAKRTELQKSFVNEHDFLKSLDMKSDVHPFTPFNTPRVTQLSQRSNQYNLRTTRYTEEAITKISNSDKHFTLSFTLEDKYGDNGLICVVILEKRTLQALFIETWLMSCRVLKRGMESFVLNSIVKLAKENGFTSLIGEYIPTQKNELVKNHFHSLGFTPADGLWKLKTDTYTDKANYIRLKE
jgi:FkbH-like protein